MYSDQVRVVTNLHTFKMISKNCKKIVLWELFMMVLVFFTDPVSLETFAEIYEQNK